ncbi:hypothetical protein BDV06DRAFT_188205 [Aspergillus oleicola]
MSISSSGKGGLASRSTENVVQTLGPSIEQSIATLEGHSPGIRSVAWSSYRSQSAFGSVDQTIRIWDHAAIQGISAPEWYLRWVVSRLYQILGTLVWFIALSQDRKVRDG